MLTLQGKDHRHAALDLPYGHPATEVPSRPTPNSGLSRQPNAERQFEIFWNEYEESHSELERPAHTPNPFTSRISRHVDLLEALFSSHRYKIQTRTLSPITPYNEDIAERNMARFPLGMTKTNTTPRSTPTMYQEDVADRNIAISRSGSPFLPSLSGRSSQATALRSGWEGRPIPEGSKCDFRELSRGKEEEIAKMSVPKSQGDLHSVFTTQNEDSVMPIMRTVQSCPIMRTHRPVPDLLAEDTGISRGGADLHHTGHLGVPPAYKQGDVLSNTPLPDSPTLPVGLMHDHGLNKNGEEEPISREPVLPNRDFQTSSSSRSRASSQRSARKNVRDLSIDTEAAALGKRHTKIAHRAIQPPTPSDSEKQNPSIAEVISSPLPPPSPFHGLRAPDSTNSFKEMLNAFKQACIPKETTNSQPTCESLQDAIVREINSHEAFQRVPVPDNGPPFSPSASQEVPFDQDLKPPKRTASRSGRNLLVKENQITKLISRGSLKKRARDPAVSESMSTGTSSTGYEKLFRRAPGPASRRRHTDAPVPSRDLLNSMEPTQQTSIGESTQQTPRAGGHVQKSHHQRSSTSIDQVGISGSSFGRPGAFETSVGSTSRGISEPSNLQGSVYYMRAHSEGLPSNDRDSCSAQDDEDEIVQLPSVEYPRLPYQGVDENNVTYIMNNATSDDAYRLMNWPKTRGEPAARQEQWPL